VSYEHYSRVWAAIWLEPWTEDMRMLAFYVLTGPHRRSEGLYRLPLEYASSDLHWSAKRLRAAFDALVAADFIEYDHDTQILLVVNALKRHKLNGKQRTGVVNAFRELPPTPLRERFQSLSEAYDKDLAELLTDACGRNGATLAN
jgi:hypothetical protein